MRLGGGPSRDPLSQAGGLLPNNRPKDKRIRRLGLGVGVAITIGGVLAVAVWGNGMIVRMEKHKTRARQSSGASTGGQGAETASRDGTTQVATLQNEAGQRHQPPPPTPAKAAAHKSAPPGDKGGKTAAKGQSADPTAHLVQQAWMQYVSAVIKQTQDWTDQRRQALTAGLTVGAPTSGGGAGETIKAAFKPTAGSQESPSNPFAGMKGLAGNDGSAGTGADNAGGGPIQFGGAGGKGGMSPSLSAAQKASYLGKLRGNPDYLGTAREAPISPDVLRAGTVIPAEMETGIKSDLPGQILARVTSNVYNTPDGSEVLIPQGAELIGTYDNDIANGQRRVLVVWNRIIYPDGSSLDIGSMPGASPNGYAGFHDQVNDHYFRIFGDALVMSLFSAGVQLSQPQAAPNSVYSSQQVIAGSLGQQLGQTGQTLINHDLNIAPTLTIRKGYRFDVMITRDLVIKPWQSVASLGRKAAPASGNGNSPPMWIAEPVQQNHLAAGGLATGSRNGDTNGQPRSAAARAADNVLSRAALLPPSTAPRKDGAVQFVPSLPVPPGAAQAVQQAAPLPAPPPVPSWSLAAGPLIGRQLGGWGGQAGWHVIWDVGQDWPVPRPSQFKGSFATAAGQVIEDLAAEGAPVHATFYRGNHTLVITGDTK